jgi:nitrogen regulatory protein P-II 1
MKQIIIYIDPERTSEILDILNEHNVGGVGFYDIMGAGPVERKPVYEMVRTYMTGKTIIPEHVKITKIETVVPDSLAQEIVDDILNRVQSEKDPQGIIFVKDVDNAYMIGTKQSGEDAIRKR